MGNEKKAYSVHESLVPASSPFLDKALSGKRKESALRTVHLPNDEPEMIAIYVHWLYRGTLPVSCDDSGIDTEYTNLVKAYILGDRLLDFKFQNAAIDAIIEKVRTPERDNTRWYPGLDVIIYAYANTTESALIRELFVDLYFYGGKSAWLDKWITAPQPFLLSLACKLLDRNGETKLPTETHKYHKNDDALSPKK